MPGCSVLADLHLISETDVVPEVNHVVTISVQTASLISQLHVCRICPPTVVATLIV